MSIRLTPASRTAIRKAIMETGKRWDDFRRANEMSFASMTRDDYVSTCQKLGIDYEKIVLDTDGEIKRGNRVSSRSFGAAILADADDRDADEIIERERQRLREKAAAAVAAQNEAREEAREEWNDESNSIAARISSAIAAAISSLAAQSLDKDQIRNLVKHEIGAALENFEGAVTKIELHHKGVKVGEVDGHQHAQFPKLLRAATARDASGYAPNVWISGPAGSGKTHAVSMVARALEDDFHYNGAIGMQHELLGFVDAGGKYHTTPFRKAYEHGGCYLFDEVDGSDNSALLALNAALANGKASFPDISIERHKDCRIFASANTWGFGGTADYVGRSKIDAAFLSRFPVRIAFDYDEALERNICGNEEFACRVQSARAKARTAGLKVLITPRDSIAGAALIAAGMSHQEAAEMTFLAALTAEQRSMIS